MNYTADEHGRLQGFRPGVSYHVTRDANDVTQVVTADLRQREITLPIPIDNNGLDYLKSHGLNPDNILNEGHSASGYQELLRDSKGERLPLVEGRPDFVFRNWPIGFNYLEFVRLARGGTA